MKIIVYGTPLGKKSPHFFRRGGKVGSFNPYGDAEKDFHAAVAGQTTEKVYGAVLLAVDMYFRRPKSHYGTGKNATQLKITAPKFHTRKPDFSNVLKFIEDCMKNVVFEDDSNVVGLDRSRKHWVHNWEDART